jgi:hypothetical protein
MLVASDRAGKNMCDRCKPLDWEIESFRRLHKRADEPLALTLIVEAIADLQHQKASLHPEKK